VRISVGLARKHGDHAHDGANVPVLGRQASVLILVQLDESGFGFEAGNRFHGSHHPQVLVE
jgi:hypothetical protein